MGHALVFQYLFTIVFQEAPFPQGQASKSIRCIKPSVPKIYGTEGKNLPKTSQLIEITIILRK